MLYIFLLLISPLSKSAIFITRHYFEYCMNQHCIWVFRSLIQQRHTHLLSLHLYMCVCVFQGTCCDPAASLASRWMEAGRFGAPGPSAAETAALEYGAADGPAQTLNPNMEERHVQGLHRNTRSVIQHHAQVTSHFLTYFPCYFVYHNAFVSDL